MAAYTLRLYQDRLGAKAAPGEPLPPRNRVLYAQEGLATIASYYAYATLSENGAWYSDREFTMTGGTDGARVLRYELVASDRAEPGEISGEHVSSTLLLDATLDLEPGDGYLMRCDRVDLPPGGIAYTHTHQGGGIRCLLNGGFVVETEGHRTEIAPGEAWFEAGPSPVLAWAPEDRVGHFSRVMILPRSLLGKSSLSYVKPEDADKPKLQKYTVFIDRIIEI
jgi:hypothetical protein